MSQPEPQRWPRLASEENTTAVTALTAVPAGQATTPKRAMVCPSLFMQDVKDSHPPGAGGYACMTAKEHHQFTCLAACTFYATVDGALDIHYVDKDGKEISPEEALKATLKSAAKEEGAAVRAFHAP